MTAFKVYTGICRKGPLNGQVQTRESTKLSVPGKGGAYYFTPAVGATPGEWCWVETKGTR